MVIITSFLRLFCVISLLAMTTSARRKDCNCFDLTLTETQRNARSNQICYTYQVSRRLTTNYCMGLDVSSFMLGTGQCSVQQRDRVLIDYEPSDLVIGYKSKPFNALSMEKSTPQIDSDKVYDTYKLCFDSSSVGKIRKTSKVAWKFSSGDMTQCDVRLTLPKFCLTAPPTPMPTDSPTVSPTDNPTQSPTDFPTNNPTKVPTSSPTDNPTMNPSDVPTSSPTDNPTQSPTNVPTNNPSEVPTSFPTANPTANPTVNPTANPTSNPTENPIDSDTDSSSSSSSSSGACGGSYTSTATSSIHSMASFTLPHSAYIDVAMTGDIPTYGWGVYDETGQVLATGGPTTASLSVSTELSSGVQYEVRMAGQVTYSFTISCS